MRTLLLLSLLLSLALGTSQDIQVQDTYSKKPVPFATVSFGDGMGTFADANGVFRFSKEIYSRVDTLFVSSIGYQTLTIPANSISDYVDLVPVASKLETVVVNAELIGDFEIEEIKPIVHKDYENCWLPTVESEIAIKIERHQGLPTMISKLFIPILLEKSQRSRDKMRKFSSIFRVQFYDVEQDGSPSFESLYPSKTFLITEQSEKIYELDITDLKIVVPRAGVFASIQVLGYAKPNGDLINAKKYREIKTRTGYTKVSTTYRPLLPFTDDIDGNKTWVRRIFLNNKKWQLFDLDYNNLSKLVRSGHNNYGMGAELRVYEKD